ncbi:hypothetical protein PV08_02819 [Exophiala spinifera]|uniref:Cytochrome P450 monooxygenase n=1 Tax=Exophiala spinifera TaxID=91928 RepID=A0A0D1YTJ2_9EURO|nr:uncharacterized protein PV08_02819 [Exophiala spinifera]KIW18531.1 hypothetical protein PV08_02819 [Exophiala spinifera]
MAVTSTFDSLANVVAPFGIVQGCVTLVLAVSAWVVLHATYNVYFHPLASCPGPRLAAATSLYKAYIDVFAKTGFVQALEKLHAQYGSYSQETINRSSLTPPTGNVVRVGPNELHFSNPEVYHEIYNANNRWDKEKNLYHSFGEDRSSFGFLEYRDAKPRKDILARLFSKKAITEAEGLVVALCESFRRHTSSPVNLHYAFRCMSIDVITYLCFGNSVDALNTPDHEAPIILALDASTPVFPAFKHSSIYKNMIIHCPPSISKVISPQTAGLVDLQQVLKKQIDNVTSNPDNLKKLPHSTTIYHELLKPELNPGGQVPSAGSLYEESQALMFGGADTTGATLMHGSFYIMTKEDVRKKLIAELRENWEDLDQPLSLAALEKLPYLTAVIKESLRISPGVASPLPRVVPDSGTTIGGRFIPGRTVVEMSSHFVHRNADIFEEPNEFRPERWLGPDARKLERWLVSFSRGPRSCLGLNLAWAELYLTFAYVFREFDVEMDPSSPKELRWRDCFLPEYLGPHLKANMTPVAT